MFLRAVKQAEERLRQAEDALRLLEAAGSNISLVRPAWSNFLQSVSAVYSKLEQGSKCNSISLAWYGRIKSERKKDELLRYLHHARDVDYHTIDDITKLKDGGLRMSGGGHYKIDMNYGTPNDFLRVEHIGGPPPIIKIEPPCIEMITVVDSRYKDVFDPPSFHLGAPIPDLKPVTAAKLTIEYLNKILGEAKNLECI